jgi:hypothetical protein
MFRFISTIAAVIALTGSVFLLGSSPALAAGISVSSADGSFQVTGDGYTANERVATWLTFSDGSSLDLGYINANGSGELAFTLTPDASWVEGEVIVATHGMQSKLEQATKFIHDDTSDAPPDSGAIDPSGLTYNYYGTGYTPGERVSPWYQSPSNLNGGTAIPLPDVFADADGVVRFPMTVGSDWEYGGHDYRL